MRLPLHKAISVYINPFFDAEEFLEAFWFFSAAYIIYWGGMRYHAGGIY